MTRARILADYVSSGDELALKAPITNAALVTPNLGTPSAGTMTNVTGMPLAGLSATGTASATTFLRGDNAWAAAGGEFADGGEAGGGNRSLGNTDAYDFSFETNDVAHLVIEGAGGVSGGQGIIDMPQQSSISVWGSVATSVASSSTKITFGTELWDNQNEFDSATNNRFTATKAGIYLVHSSVRMLSVGLNNVLSMMIKVDGSVETAFSQIPNAENINPFLTGTAIVKLTASQYVEIWCYHNDSSSRNSQAAIYSTFLNIHKLS